MPAFLPMDQCENPNCGAYEERLFTDSWTGKRLCLQCLGPVWDQVTNSPASEPDNLLVLLDMTTSCSVCGWPVERNSDGTWVTRSPGGPDLATCGATDHPHEVEEAD